jgi:HD-GYP domain-containing protein (c-di-GMP phosphodiesterase class II)
MVALAVDRDPSGFLPVAVATIVPSRVIGIPLFVRDLNCSLPRLYRGSDYPLTDADLAELMARGVNTLHIRSVHYQRYQEYIRQSLSALLADPAVPSPRRLEALDHVARDVLSDVFRSKSVERAVEQADVLGRHIVAVVNSDDFIASHLLRVIHHDYHTFAHSLNVACFVVAMARAQGWSDQAVLHRLSIGALLHDVGKLHVPDAILTKPGRLSEEELKALEAHPTLGFRSLCSHDNLTFEQLMMVYQHHERLDGRGYPVGVIGDEIHPWARLCAVADAFEALTSNRPYRPALPLEQALSTMQRQAGTALDEEILACWIQTIRDSSQN